MLCVGAVDEDGFDDGLHAVAAAQSRVVALRALRVRHIVIADLAEEMPLGALQIQQG